MKLRLLAAVAILSFALTAAIDTSSPQETQGAKPSTNPTSNTSIENPKIDAEAFLRVSAEATQQRKTCRVSEDEFIRMAGETGTMVLDARSKEKYDMLHIKGAINLSFPDISFESLARVLPDKNARILIYCNNNFKNAEAAFPTKSIAVPLNVPTYITLYAYGYRNIYELAPLIDMKKPTKLTFESTPTQAVTN